MAELSVGKLILAINPGSSSVKFGIFRPGDSGAAELYRGSIESIGSNPKFTVRSRVDSEVGSGNSGDFHTDSLATREAAYELILQFLKAKSLSEQIGRVCYRVVHGGSYFSAPVRIDASVLDKLESLIPLAPLHQPIGIEAIRLFTEHFSRSQHIACFDTAFHRTMPKIAQMFALPGWLHEQGIRSYGFHGLSYQYSVERVASLNEGVTPRRIVIAHLGSGASMCALLDGKSAATSMTFSPLDGLPMATRCGSLDANAVLYMIDHLELSTKKVSDILNKESGLLGLSGLSGDVRILIASDSEDARIALDFYIDRICRELGAMTGILQGLDALVFTGGVGANNPVIRERVCERLEWLGVSLRPVESDRREENISSPSSQIAVYAIEADEEHVMAELAAETG